MPRPYQAVAAALLLAGCAVPQSAVEFRGAASRALLPRTGTMEVGRELGELAAVLAKKAPECLDGTVTATTKTITNYQEIIRTYVTTYRSTVVSGAERVELHVQWHTRGEIHAMAVPEGGAYRLVVDAYPSDGGRTRLQWFDATASRDFLLEAVKGWATGQNMQCPDLTKNW